MSALEAVEGVEAFRVTTPAATLSTAPLESSLVFDPAEVIGIEIIIPAGHKGETGIRLAQSHQQVIPRGFGQWITGDNEPIKWPLSGFVDSGNWQSFTYNEDVIDHDHLVRFLLAGKFGGEEPEEIPIPIIIREF